MSRPDTSMPNYARKCSLIAKKNMTRLSAEQTMLAKMISILEENFPSAASLQTNAFKA